MKIRPLGKPEKACDLEHTMTTEEIDATRRHHAGNCPYCGKPRGGYVPAGMTPETAGLCTCWKKGRKP